MPSTSTSVRLGRLQDRLVVDRQVVEDVLRLSRRTSGAGRSRMMYAISNPNAGS